MHTTKDNKLEINMFFHKKKPLIRDVQYCLLHRIYCMDSVDELIEFRKELLKRPLVLQPIIQAGSGIQRLDCFFCVKKGNYCTMFNFDKGL